MPENTRPENMRTVVVDSLRQMNFDVSGVEDDTVLGEGGLELESLSLAELVMQLGDHGAQFSDDELDTLLDMTFGALVAEAERRAGVPAGAQSE